MAAKSAAGLLTSVDSMFTTQEERDNAQRSYVIDLPAAQISDFPDHPFKVRMDESMMELADSVKQHGILVPSLVRPMPDGSYQMVSGHRRKRAAELAELPTVPCIVQELTDDEAIIIMVDSNLQSRQHTETVSVPSQSKDMGAVLALLPQTKEFVTEDGLAGTLALKLDTVKVEVAGYGSSTKNITATRTYPGLADQDTQYIPKSITDNGHSLTLQTVNWQTEGDGHFTAVASYSGSATSSYVKGYTVTADYAGTVSRINLNKIRYVAIFEGTALEPAPTEEPGDTTDPGLTDPADPTAPVDPTGPTDTPTGEKNNVLPVVAVVVVVLLGGGAFYFIKRRR
ncbi:ParB/RepB/Spo0J family partition protein [Oscillospiraceae bacterium 42-9]